MFWGVLLISILLSLSAGADQARYLVTSRDALNARIRLIQEAKYNISAEYFITSDDSISVTELGLLRDAARRGVEVNLAFDGLAAGTSKKFIAALLMEPRIHILYFNQFNIFHPLEAFKRNHSKQLNIDGERVIIGGRNVTEAYYGLDPKKNFLDLDVLVKGQGAKEARDYFDVFWKTSLQLPYLYNFADKEFNAACGTREDMDGCERRKIESRLQIAQANHLMDLATERVYALENPLDWLEEVEDFGPIVFLSNLPDKKVSETEHRLIDQFNSFLSQAKEEVIILTPYVVPLAETLDVIEDLLKKGVKIKILTNSIKSSDTAPAQAGYLDIKNYIIGIGVELYEFDSSSTIHGKAVLIDKKDVLVGSPNLDIRSAIINREIAVVVHDRPGGNFSSEFEIFFNNYLKESLLVGKDHQIFNEGFMEKQVTDLTKLKLKVLQILLPLYRNQL